MLSTCWADVDLLCASNLESSDPACNVGVNKHKELEPKNIQKCDPTPSRMQCWDQTGAAILRDETSWKCFWCHVAVSSSIFANATSKASRSNQAARAFRMHLDAVCFFNCRKVEELEKTWTSYKKTLHWCIDTYWIILIHIKALTETAGFGSQVQSGDVGLLAFPAAKGLGHSPWSRMELALGERGKNVAHADQSEGPKRSESWQIESGQTREKTMKNNEKHGRPVVANAHLLRVKLKVVCKLFEALEYWCS